MMTVLLVICGASACGASGPPSTAEQIASEVTPTLDLRVDVAPGTSLAMSLDGNPRLMVDHDGRAPRPIASITKLITALVVLDAAPLDSGASGPFFEMEDEDQRTTDDLRRSGAKVLGLRSGDRLTERQLLEGMLVPSGADAAFALARATFGSFDAYRGAAGAWLSARGFRGTVVLDPAGVSGGNIAPAHELMILADLVMRHPVLREIVAMPSVELPRLGTFETTNPLLGDDEVIGIKTGTLEGSYRCLLFAVRLESPGRLLYGVVLGAQSGDELALLARGLISAAREAGVR